MSGSGQESEHQQDWSIDQVAAHWVARADRGLSQDERIALNEWCAADLRHSGSYLRARALSHLAAMSEAPAIIPVPHNDDVAVPSHVMRARRGVTRMTIAASVVVAVFLGVFQFAIPRDPGAKKLSTHRGEIREIALNEGSTAVLDTNTAIAVAMQPRIRSIELLRGDAYFKVAHDERRPFEVRSNGLVVRAIGTAFQVSKLTDGAEVIVSEGKVAIYREGAANPIILLAAGNRFRLAQGQAMREPLELKQVEQQLAWRDGTIILDGQTLASAAAELNRYNDQQLSIADERLGAEQIYGTFRVRDPEALAKAATIAFGAKATYSIDTIELSK